MLNENESPTQPSSSLLASKSEMAPVDAPLSRPLASSTVSLTSLNLTVEELEVQLTKFLDDGGGECLFHLGPDEKSEDNVEQNSRLLNEWEKHQENLLAVCAKLGADCTSLRKKRNGGADYMIRKNLGDKDFVEIRVAVVGNVDAGKSTLLGVLTHGELDNGRGHARLKLFRHKHEIESGRTSSVGNDILGFDTKGNIVNKPDPHGSHLNWAQICADASKVVTFIDLAGHERYLKTTIFGMTGHAPDYCMLMVGANAGVIGMTKEHLGLALALNVPVFVVVTKIDMCPQNVLDETMRVLHKLLKSPGCRKLPILVNNVEHVLVSASNFMSERICPVFRVSNVSGENMDLLKMFLNLLMLRFKCDRSEPAEFQIDDTYAVPGVGTVVSGTCTKGLIRLNDVLQLGPDGCGRFIPVPVKSIHRKRMPVASVAGGQTASFSLKKIKRSTIRKGMVMISLQLEPRSCWEFEADVLVLHHPTTISPKYQAMIHCGGVRQTATILSMTRDCLRTGDKATVHFRFIKAPEYLHSGQKLVFREGRTKAVGNISKTFPFVPSNAPPHQKPKRPVFEGVVDDQGVLDPSKSATDPSGDGLMSKTKMKSSKRQRRYVYDENGLRQPIAATATEDKENFGEEAANFVSNPTTTPAGEAATPSPMVTSEA